MTVGELKALLAKVDDNVVLVTQQGKAFASLVDVIVVDKPAPIVVLVGKDR
jgi:hypothetical protein